MSEGIEELRMTVEWSEKYGHEQLNLSVEDGRKVLDYVDALEAQLGKGEEKPVPAPVTLAHDTLTVVSDGT